jgi:hypothetical protein
MAKKRGRPVKHKVYCQNNGKTYSSCTEAAKDIGGFRNKVYLTATGQQSHHHGYKFSFLNEEE